MQRVGGPDRDGRRRRPYATFLAAGLTMLGCSGSAPRVLEAVPVSSRTGTTAPPQTTRPLPDDPTITTSSAAPSRSTGASTTSAPGVGPTSRSLSAGDPRFPRLGSADLDVAHYDVELVYDPVARALQGTVTIELATTSATDQLALDAETLDIGSVSVDGGSRPFVAADRKLLITLPAPVAAETDLVVEIDYRVPLDADRRFADDAGIFVTEGGFWSANEPDGTSTWMPVNDHPTDKATWSFAVTVPDPAVAVANGKQVGSTPAAADSTTWTWEQ